MPLTAVASYIASGAARPLPADAASAVTLRDDRELTPDDLNTAHPTSLSLAIFFLSSALTLSIFLKRTAKRQSRPAAGEKNA